MTYRCHNGSEYQATYEKFINLDSSCDAEFPTVGPHDVNYEVTYIYKLLDTSIGVVSQVHNFIGYFFKIWGSTQ